jgi:hypothetical protein
VLLGDALTFPAAGIQEAIVTGVYQVSGETGNHKGGGCCSSPSAKKRATNQVVVTLDQAASVSVSCDNTKPVQVKGRSLGEFSFEIDDSCDVVTCSLDASVFSSLNLPSDQCGAEAYRVGCYQITLVAGVIPRPGYPSDRQYSTWRRTISFGDVYLRPSLF